MYDLEKAASILRLAPSTLRQYVYQGRVSATRTEEGFLFGDKALELYRTRHPNPNKSGRPILTPETWAEPFDEKYGEGSHQRLLKLLKTAEYGRIAKMFGVTKQRVCQWNKIAGFKPRHPGVSINDLRRELFDNELFDAFYRMASGHFPTQDMEPVLDKYGGHFLARSLKLRGKKVTLRKGTKVKNEQRHGGKVYRYEENAYALNTSGYADFFFYLLRDDNFLFVPREFLPPNHTVFFDSERRKYYGFKNNFDALD